MRAFHQLQNRIALARPQRVRHPALAQVRRNPDRPEPDSPQRHSMDRPVIEIGREPLGVIGQRIGLLNRDNVGRQFADAIDERLISFFWIVRMPPETERAFVRQPRPCVDRQNSDFAASGTSASLPLMKLCLPSAQMRSSQPPRARR